MPEPSMFKVIPWVHKCFVLLDCHRIVGVDGWIWFQSVGFKGKLDRVHPHDACILSGVSASISNVCCIGWVSAQVSQLKRDLNSAQSGKKGLEHRRWVLGQTNSFCMKWEFYISSWQWRFSSKGRLQMISIALQ